MIYEFDGNIFSIEARKLTDLSLAREILEFTNPGLVSKMSLDTLYFSEHSPARSQIFIIKMKDIPTKVAMHLRTHEKNGQLHVIKSNREDWNEGNDDKNINRMSKVNHVMMMNAQHIIDMSKKRLCSKAENFTRYVMQCIREEINDIDPSLASVMMPNCFYRGGICPEIKPCGKNRDALKTLVGLIPEKVYRELRNNAIIEGKVPLKVVRGN